MKTRVENMIYLCAYYALKFNGKAIPTEKGAFPSHLDIHNAMVKASGLNGIALPKMMEAMGYAYSRSDLNRYRSINKEVTSNFLKGGKKKKKKDPKPQPKPPIRKPVATEDFFASRDWRELRYRALEKHGGACQCCGRSRKAHGVVLHVDHIKPRSKFPELELDINNLQILCEDCNLGKSNRYTTDWR